MDGHSADVTAALAGWDTTSRPERDGNRGRDVAALISLMFALAALWAATFSVSTRSWGEYRPDAADIQEAPPPPTVLIPALTLDEARRIVNDAADGGASLYEDR